MKVLHLQFQALSSKCKDFSNLQTLTVKHVQGFPAAVQALYIQTGYLNDLSNLLQTIPMLRDLI